MGSAWVSLDVGDDGVAVITFSNPPVNLIGYAVVAGLREKYAEAMNRSDVKAIVLTGDGENFAGGFDISIFGEVQKTGDISLLPEVSVSLLKNVIEDGPKPSVAAIQGLACGGGLEFPMGCHGRVSTPEAQLVLPELNIGVITGLGGSQRLPRLVGLPKALEMLLQAKSIGSKEGKEFGLIDEICTADELIKVSRLLALDIAEGRKPWISSLQRTDKLGSLDDAREILKGERKQVKKTAPNMPQYQGLLDVVEEGIACGGYSGLLKEEKVFKELILSDTSRSLFQALMSQLETKAYVDCLDGQKEQLLSHSEVYQSAYIAQLIAAI